MEFLSQPNLLDALECVLPTAGISVLDTPTLGLLGSVPADFAAAVRQRYRNATVLHFGPEWSEQAPEQIGNGALQRPWSTPVRKFDAVVAAIPPGYLLRPVVEYISQLASRLVLDARTSPDLCSARLILSKFGFLTEMRGPVLTACHPAGKIVPRRPILVHVHIPKTAGTSFNKLLEQTFGERHLNCHSPQPGFEYSPEAFAQILWEHPGLVSISSHSFRCFPHTVADRIPLYVCFLRQPLNRLISNMAYIKENLHAFPEPVKRYYPHAADRLPIRELLCWCLDRGGELGRLGHATHYLAESEWNAAIHSLYPPHQRTEAAAGTLRRCYDELAGELAQQVLERFLFVGLTEQTAESVKLLSLFLAPYALSLAGLPGRANGSKEDAISQPWLTANDEVGRRALAYAQVDEPLYRYALRRMDRQQAAVAALSARQAV